MIALAASASQAGGIERVPALEQLMRASLVSSPVLNAKRSDLAAARSDIDAARWQYTPSVSADLQQGSGPNTLNGRVLRVDQKLYAGGRLDADLGGARARRDSAVYAVQESALALSVQIVSGFQSLAAANRQVAAIGQYRQRLDALQGTISRRIESGVSAQADQSLMSARLVQSQNDLALARAAQRGAVATLSKLVGDTSLVEQLAPDVAVPASTTLPTPAALCADNASADSQLRAVLTQHPAVQRIERDIAAARASVQSQRAALQPALGVRVEQPIAPATDATLRSTRVSLVLQYAPDAGLSGLSRAQAGNERVGSLVNQADALQREIVQQIRGECAEQASVIERVAGYAQARGYTTEVLASSTRLFIAGKRGWLDVLNAAREDFDNEQAGIVAGAALLGSQYRLALLTGERTLPLPGVADEPPSDLRHSLQALLP